jgi:hypothetical protein
MVNTKFISSPPRGANPLDALANAKVYHKTPYFEPNNTYLVAIDELKLVERATDKSLMFVVECTVLEGSTEGVGQPRAQICNLHDKWGYGLSDLKKILAGILGTSISTLEDSGGYSRESVERLCAEDQPCRGFRSKVVTTANQKKNKPGEYVTVHAWSSDGERTET